MPRIELITVIEAPAEVVFNLSRSIDFHQDSVPNSKERAIDGRVTGLIELGEFVTWEAVHFGVKQKLTSKIVSMEAPHRFRDSMVHGAFKRFDHDHIFEAVGANTTKMVDLFDYDSPLGLLGQIADKLFLENYMSNLLTGRNKYLKTYSENGKWKQYIK